MINGNSRACSSTFLRLHKIHITMTTVPIWADASAFKSYLAAPGVSCSSAVVSMVDEIGLLCINEHKHNMRKNWNYVNSYLCRFWIYDIFFCFTHNQHFNVYSFSVGLDIFMLYKVFVQWKVTQWLFFQSTPGSFYKLFGRLCACVWYNLYKSMHLS